MATCFAATARSNTSNIRGRPLSGSARGDIVGNYVGSDNMSHKFLFQDGVFTTIDIPNAAWTDARGSLRNPRTDAPSPPRGLSGTCTFHGCKPSCFKYA